MAEFRMPSLGADMESGTLVEWKVKPGDRVKRGDLIATVETVKGAIDVEVFQAGVIEKLLVEPGAVVPVNGLMALLRGEGEPEPVSPPPAPAAPAAAEPVRHLRASPAAKRMASELGIDLGQVHGSGPNGAITLGDVQAAAVGAPPAVPPPAPRPRPVDAAAAMRGAIAAAMSRSKREIPHYYLATDVDFGRAQSWLEQQNVKRPVTDRLLPVALLLRATVVALAEVPELNGTFTDGAFHQSQTVNLGVAINLRGGGLIAPAILEAQRLTVSELMARLMDLVARTRSSALRSSELGSGTLTVSNLGDQGVGLVFPVIQPPQVAMVGFGRITHRPWVLDGHVEPRPVVTASLAGDHRVSDGHRGGRFLAAIEKLLLEPEKL
ncbi:MAG: catalytic domain of component of various dehydrogenase complexe [Myxococcaceae bacterium]|nr:catalytic domain of component of various dehydrogenase complexe [Myxococcaceae bacterium]